MARSSGPRHEPPATPPADPKPAPRKRKSVASPARLRVRFLTHVARQIDRFDAALEAEGASPGFDSAKVLRDLRGLKQLLDELRTEEAGHDAGGPPLDLVALRADIARRYAAFEAEEPDDELPGPPPGDASSGP